ncbi:hypothetical protein FHX34_105166 [Actinoplanes teichomyceticus]|uniref:Uncharacterized protein n=2 Tax=Actinoplanes teichomyceticus TaxID=1867 RepID=A0A561VKZ8_ACTTI|nr:hypothetical protein FHX34_105166 [Actinoplanes teichomyceticus]
MGLAVLGGAAGCDDAAPAPRAVSSEIRGFDFGAAEWVDAMSASTVQLTGGRARRAPAAAWGGMSWQMLGPSAYLDLDADGDEDAAVGLHSHGGQMFSFAWYIWLWQDGRAVQVRRPIAETSRCAGPIDSVTATPAGFQVRMLITEMGRDDCAGGGSVPVTYVVGIRDGWPVRVAPDFGPIETCNPHELTVPLSPPSAVQLRTAPDDAAPPIGSPARYATVLTTELAVSPYLSAQERGDWLLVTAVAAGGHRRCGWARADQVLPG